MPESINVAGTNNEKVPFEKDKELRSRIKQYAEEHGFVVSEFVDRKIRWSETHGGRCFCSPLERLKCPCDNIYEDMKLFNGRCMCRLFWKPEAYAKWLEQNKKQKKITDVKKKVFTKEEKAQHKQQIDDVWKQLEGKK